MDLMISKLNNGYLISWCDPESYKTYREAFVKESDMWARCKELFSQQEND